MPYWRVYCHETIGAHIGPASTWKADGFRPASIALQCPASSPSGPEVPSGQELFSGIWVQRSGPDFHIKHVAHKQELLDWVDDEIALGFNPRLITAGGQGHRFYCCVTEEGGPPSRVQLDIPVVLFDVAQDAARGNGEHPISIAAAGLITSNSPGDYTSVIWQNTGRRDVHFRIYLTAESHLAALDGALTAGFSQPQLISVTEATPAQERGYTVLYTDHVIGGLQVHPDVPANEFHDFIGSLIEQDRWPLHLSTGSVSPSKRFTFVTVPYPVYKAPRRAWRVRRAKLPTATSWSADQVSSAPDLAARGARAAPPPPTHLVGLQRRPIREARVNVHPMLALGGHPTLGRLDLPEVPTSPGPPGPPGPGSSPNQPPGPGLLGGLFSPFQDFDQWVKSMMVQWGIRAGQLAIVHQDRLVYAAAYTRAEPGYPATQVTTRMRLGSVSKTITGMAVWRGLEMGLYNNLDVPLGPLMQWTVIADTRFNQRSIRQFLTHTSRFDNDAVKLDPVVVRDFFPGQTFPLQPGQLADYVAANVDSAFLEGPAPQPSAANPPPGVYSNFGFYLLGQMVARVGAGNPAAYPSFVRNNVFNRIGLFAGPEIAVNTAAEAAINDDEVRYHPFDPLWGGTVLNDSGTLVPYAYDTHNFPLEVPGGSWSMSAAQYARLLAAFSVNPNPLFAASTTQVDVLTNVAVGNFQGFGEAIVEDANGNLTIQVMWHNGWFPGSSALVFRRLLDEVGVVVMFNCDVPRADFGGGGWGETLNALINLRASWPSTDLWEAAGIGPW